VGAEYKLWYSGETLPQAWQTGYAMSSNGSDWTGVTMLIPEGSSGAFDAASADHASVLVDGDKFKIWYSGLNKGGYQTIGYATAGICRGAGVPSGHPVYLPLVVKSPQIPCPAYYTNNFGNPDSGWPVADDSSRRYAYTSGEYQIWVRNPHQGWSVTPGAKVTDFAAAVSARRTSGALGAYGIQFGINEYWSQFYEFIVENASYSIWRYDNGSWTALQDWTASGHISTGTNWNRLKVIRNGANIAVYANSQLLATVSDSSFTGLRWIGLVAYSPDANGTNCAYLYKAVTTDTQPDPMCVAIGDDNVITDWFEYFDPAAVGPNSGYQHGCAYNQVHPFLGTKANNSESWKPYTTYAGRVLRTGVAGKCINVSGGIYIPEISFKKAISKYNVHCG
jgi:hypothetical protein